MVITLCVCVCMCVRVLWMGFVYPDFYVKKFLKIFLKQEYRVHLGERVNPVVNFKMSWLLYLYMKQVKPI